MTLSIPKLPLLLLLSTIPISTPFSHRTKPPPLQSHPPDDEDRRDDRTLKRKKKKKQKLIRKYSYFDWQDVHEIMIDLAEDYPELVTLSNAQVAYHLPAAGKEDDCPLDDDYRRRLARLDEFYHQNNRQRLLQNDSEIKGCLNWFLTIHDTVTHANEETFTQPELFLSGTVHGNERIGPTAVLETAALLLESAACEGLPHEYRPSSDASQIVQEEWEDEVEEARDCRKFLEKKGITHDERKWLARLVATRRIVVVPTANSLGYFRGEREEDGIDPNSDFPFDLKEEEKGNCMQTIAARTINELFWAHMFQLGITFHAGTTVVAYEWGSPTYDGKVAPDDESQRQISEGYSRFGGGNFDWGAEPYNVGTMADLVFPVRGGMEDWAYASSWDKERGGTCKPETYGGYDPKRTQYRANTHRCFNVLVETSLSKSPPTSHLGNDYDIFNPTKKGNGHIPRNIRVNLMMIDIVEPYLSILSVNGNPLQDDIVPMQRREKRSCMNTKAVNIPSNADHVSISYTVGGGFSVDNTAVLYANWNDLPEDFDCMLQQPIGDTYDLLEKTINGTDDASEAIGMTKLTYGKTRWHEDGSDPSPSSKSTGLGMGPRFFASIDLSPFREGDQVAVFAYATMDQSWATQPRKSQMEPDLPPQTHLVSVRTNPKHHSSYYSQRIQGRLNWFSTPVTLNIGPPDTPVVEMAIRLPAKMESRMHEIEEEVEEEIESHQAGTIVVVCLIMLSTIGFLVYKRRVRRKREALFKELDTELDELEMNADFSHPAHTVD